MEANMFMDEEMKQKDPEIGDVLQVLIDEIKAGMTGLALQFYEREFSFFRKVTNISGIIRPYPKGPLRKAECLKALKEVELQAGGWGLLNTCILIYIIMTYCALNNRCMYMYIHTYITSMCFCMFFFTNTH